MSGWDRARNVLAVRLDGLGDLLMTAPAIRRLRDAVPGREVTLLTSPAAAGGGALLTDVASVIPFTAPWMKAPCAPGPGDTLAMAQVLRARRFDAAVIFTTHSQSPLPAAMLCHLADIPLRLAHCRERAYHLLSDEIPEPERDLPRFHEVERQLQLVANVAPAEAAGDDGPLLAIPPRAKLSALQALLAGGIDLERPWVVVHPGASAASRRYPPALFAEVVRGMASQLGWQVALTGSAAERDLCEAIAARAGGSFAVIAGELPLASFAGLLEQAPLLISNNTGPVHIACAVGTPVVDLYALTNPQHTPWRVPNRVLSNDVPCRNCYRSVCPEGHGLCLAGIAPEAVIAAAKELAEECAVFAPDVPLQAA